MRYKPDGYTDLAPYLLVKQAEACLRFAETVFGAHRLRVFMDGARIMHAELRVGDTVVMLSEADGPDAMLHVYVPDPDAVFRTAIENGATVLQEISESGDGDRRGGFQSPCGTMWYVARQV